MDDTNRLTPPSSSAPPPPIPPSTIKQQMPIGYVYFFRPSDKELLVDYLDKRIKMLPLPCNLAVKEVAVYEYTPEYLAVHFEETGDREWFFFTARNNKSEGANRQNRGIIGGNGFWKATIGVKPVKDEGATIGFKRQLVFYQGNRSYPATVIRTNWLMTEYFMDTKDSSGTSIGLALCRIYNKDYKKGCDVPFFIGPHPRPSADVASTSSAAFKGMPTPVAATEDENCWDGLEIESNDFWSAPEPALDAATTGVPFSIDTQPGPSAAPQGATEDANWWEGSTWEEISRMFG